MTEISFNTEATVGFVNGRFNPSRLELTRFNQAEKLPDILVVSDLDGSKWGSFTAGLRSNYHPEQNRRNAEAFNRYSDRFIVADVTGQDVRMTRHLQDVYGGFDVLDFLANDSGLDLRVNQTSLAPSKFLQSLDSAEAYNPHGDWETFITSFLNKDQFYKSLQEVLHDQGFTEVQFDDTNRPLYVYPNCHQLFRSHQHPGIDVSISPGEMSVVTIETRKGQGLTDVDRLVRNISNELQHRIPGIIYQVGLGEDFGYAFFTHADEDKQISKSSIVYAILKILPEKIVNALRAIICIGDGANDRHLGLTEVARPDNQGKPLPVYRIISGQGLYDADPAWLNRDAGNLELAPDRGDIADALHRVVKQIDL